jgi:hypothetical protein
MFYTEDENSDNEHKFFTDVDDEMTENEKEGEEIIPQLERRFMPHELVSISFYEDEHPMGETAINMSICHKGPEDLPEEISKRVKSEGPVVNPNYIYKIFDSETNWNKAQQAACDYMNKGADQGFLVTTFNRTKGNKTCVVVIAWNKDTQETIEQTNRGDVTCCVGCSIF